MGTEIVEFGHIGVFSLWKRHMRSFDAEATHTHRPIDRFMDDKVAVKSRKVLS